MVRSFPRRGAAFLVLVVTLLLMSISLGIAVPRATNDVRRAKEDELRFILGEFRRAVQKFHDRNMREPRTLDELLKDKNGRAFLRRLYADPFTGKPEWVLSSESGRLVIHSGSSEMSLAGVPYSDFR